MLVLVAAVAVALAARLGAAATVAGATADGCGEIALAGVGHAQCAVAEYLDLNGGVGGDIADLLPAQLTAQHHTAPTHSGAKLHAGQIVDGHLGGSVDGNVGSDLLTQLHHTQ